MLVPQIDEVKLVVGFASHDLATSSCAEHFLQPLAAVASGEEQQPSQELGGRGRHIGVVVVQTDAEVGVLHRRVEGDRPLQGVLGPPSVKRGAQPFAAQDAPLRPRAVGASQVKAGFRSLRVALDPRLGRRNGRFDTRREVGVARRVERIELDPPPEYHSLQHQAGLPGRRPGGWATGLRQQSEHLLEPGVKDGVVGTRQLGRGGQSPDWLLHGLRRCERDDDERKRWRRQAAAPHRSPPDLRRALHPRFVARTSHSCVR